MKDINEIFDYLKENKLYVNNIEKLHILDIVRVRVDGDWKHDHLYCDRLMRELGYSYFKYEEIPSDYSDDCYIADRYYVPVENEKTVKDFGKLFS